MSQLLSIVLKQIFSRQDRRADNKNRYQITDEEAEEEESIWQLVETIVWIDGQKRDNYFELCDDH